MVPVYAYGPMSSLFLGQYDNTAIYKKMLQALGKEIQH
jgi:alkaline phosphatase